MFPLKTRNKIKNCHCQMSKRGLKHWNEHSSPDLHHSDIHFTSEFPDDEIVLQWFHKKPPYDCGLTDTFQKAQHKRTVKSLVFPWTLNSVWSKEKGRKKKETGGEKKTYGLLLDPQGTHPIDLLLGKWEINAWFVGKVKSDSYFDWFIACCHIQQKSGGQWNLWETHVRRSKCINWAEIYLHIL